MTRLAARIETATLAAVEVAYLDAGACRWWNARRGGGDVPVLAGWYWLQGPREAGPFRSRSAAVRDAWYRVVLRREPPSAQEAMTRGGTAPGGRLMVLHDPGAKRGPGRPRAGEYRVFGN